MRWLLITLLLIGCGKDEDREDVPVQPGLDVSGLTSRYPIYEKGHIRARDSHGFAFRDHCDSLGYSVMSAYGFGLRINLDAATDSDNQVHRRPTDYGNCYDSGDSESEQSRDHYVKYLFYIWRTKDVDRLDTQIRYIRDNKYFLGRGLKNRTWVTPQLWGTIMQMHYVLTGSDNPARLIGFVPGGDDYAAETSTLHGLLRWELGLSSSGFREWLLTKTVENPHNALFETVYQKTGAKDYQRAVGLLSDVSHWPLKALPTKKDNHCSEWIFERDMGPNWLPCSDGGYLTGGDWAMVARMIVEDL